MRHIFVSYCHEDADFAQILEGKLREAGLLTVRDLQLNAGDDWRSEIDEGIRGASAVIVVMSPSARISPYVNYEWAFAIGSGVPVLPLLLKIAAEELHPRLSAIQYLDFRNYLARPWERLIESIHGLAAAQRDHTLHVPRDAPPVVRAAAEALDSMDSGQRRAAISSLSEMDHPAAVDLLAEAVRHPIREVRFGAAFLLGGERRDARALPALIEALRCGNEEIEPWMISRIGQAAVPALIEALNEKEFRSRDILFNILGYIGGPAAVATLTRYLSDSDAYSRRYAAFSLTSTKDSAAVPALRRAIRDPEAMVREGVAAALGLCGGVAVIPDLLELLRDSDSSVRHRAVCAIDDALGREHDRAALEPMIPQLINDLAAALLDTYDQVAVFAGRALEKLCDTRSIPALIAAAGERNRPRRIVDLLEMLGAAPIPALREALNDSNELRRMIAVEVIAHFGDPADAPLVAENLRDKNADIRLRALRGIPPKPAPSPLILNAITERLRDPEEDVSLQAIYTLRLIRDPATIPHLVECLQTPELAQAAVNVLEEFDTREARAALKAYRSKKP